MCDDGQENTPDPLTEFLAPLLTDIPDVLPIPTTTHTSVFTPFFTPDSNPDPYPTPYHVADPQLTCQWVSSSDPPLICGAPLSRDARVACTHLRDAHHVRGNEKVHVDCRWRDCHVAPMLRGSLVRHVLTVHLGLLKWRCEVCRKVFSRKGTAHACAEDG